MASRDSGRAALDPSTAAYRRLLAGADDSEQARVEALLGLARRTVFAATWPQAPESVRSLTNSDGETAMPLFTGRDTLDPAARRFGWVDVYGRVSWRELGAREALRTALGEAVQYVVVDIGSDHVIEFSREEIESVLAAQLAGNDGEPGRATDMVRQAVRRSSRPPKLHEDYASAPPPAPSLSAPPLPSFELANERRDSAFPRDDHVRELPLHAEVTRGSVRPPAASPSGPDEVPMHALGGMPPLADRLAMPALPDLDQAPASAPRLPDPMETAPTAPSLELGFANGRRVEAGPPPLSAQDEATVDAPTAELADQELPAAAPAALGGPAQADAPGERGAAPTEQEDEPEPGALRPPRSVMSDEALAGIAQALRQFPEVEWACEVSDGGLLPVIGVRVDPSFLSRVAQITDAVVDAAGDQVSVLLLTDPETMRSARSEGSVFFPWRNKR